MLLLLALVSATLLMARISLVKAQATTVEIVPPTTTVGQDGVLIPAAGLPFKINVTVSDVTDLYAWQVRVYYYPSIVNFTSATYPTGHVFDGKNFVNLTFAQAEYPYKVFKNRSVVNFASPLNPVTTWRWTDDPEWKKYNMTGWDDVDGSATLSVSDIVWLKQATLAAEYYRVNDITMDLSTVRLTVELDYVEFGATLLGTETTFTGSGALCQFGFKGVAPGVSVLNFSRPFGADTFLLDSDLKMITFDVADGAATVLGVSAGKEPSTITLSLDKDRVQVGSNVTISGSITPVKTNVDVTIYYRTSGATTWSILATVQTDSNSQYSYRWKTTAEGTYEIKAGWSGDATHSGDESDTKTVTVTTEEVQEDFFTKYLPYIAAGIIAIVVVVVLLFWMRMRKR